MNIKLVEEKGKCYSKVNRGQRKQSDKYETPYSMTRAYIELHKDWFFRGYNFLEPAAGNGAITKVLREFGFQDIVEFDIESGQNFLDYDEPAEWIITNPPYSFAMEFIEKGFEIATVGMSLLLPLNYLQGQQRFARQIFNPEFCGFAGIDVFTRMADLSQPLREDGKYTTGMQAYAWYTWIFGSIQAPTIQWINSRTHIARKSDVERKNEG